jgi:hypothetical protein
VVEVGVAVNVVDFVARMDAVFDVVAVAVADDMDAAVTVVDFVGGDKNGAYPLVAVVQDNMIDHLLASEVPAVVVAVAADVAVDIAEVVVWRMGRIQVVVADTLGEVDIHALAADLLAPPPRRRRRRHHWVASCDPPHRHNNQPLHATT